MQGEVSGRCVEKTGEKGMLEAMMNRCTSKAKLVMDGDYVAFRRRGILYAAKLDDLEVKAKSLDKREEREEIDMIIEGIRSGRFAESAKRLTHNCIASFPFTIGTEPVEYRIPEGAEYIRRGGRMIRFFAGEPPEQKNPSKPRRRKYVPVPKGATKVRYNSGYEWHLPDGKGGFEWKK